MSAEEIERCLFSTGRSTSSRWNKTADFLNENFPQKWIGTGGPFEWPSRTPNLTPLDYFSLGYVKDEMSNQAVTPLKT